MAGLKKKRRIQLIVIGIVLMTASVALIGFAFKDGIEFFRSPSQVHAEMPSPNERFRIGGLVEEGSIIRGEGQEISFVVTDGNKTVPVKFAGILPDLFAEGQGMIATGNMENGVFIASEILAKHDEEYMPKEVIDALKEQGTYVDPEES